MMQRDEESCVFQEERYVVVSVCHLELGLFEGIVGNGAVRAGSSGNLFSRRIFGQAGQQSPT